MANSKPDISTVLDQLKKRKDCGTDADLARWLGVKQSSITRWRDKSISIPTFVDILETVANSKPDINTVLNEFKERTDCDSDADLSRWLGVNQPSINNWRNKPISTRVLTNILKKIEDATRVQTEKSQSSGLIHAIVEFHPIEKSRAKEGWLLFATSQNGERIPLLEGLKERLENTSSGVYVFYDSSGVPLYIGQAGRAGANNLWKQMNKSFNRQDINRGQYAHRINFNEEFRTVTDRGPKVSPDKIKHRLWEISASFSAYGIKAGMAGTIEALLLRVTGRILLNNRLENFE